MLAGFVSQQAYSASSSTPSRASSTTTRMLKPATWRIGWRGMAMSFC